MPKVIIDPDSHSLQEHFAIVNVPKRNRKRFAEGCVTVVDSAEIAQQQANLDQHLRAAVVYGPSSSSESQRIYYLVRWL